MEGEKEKSDPRGESQNESGLSGDTRAFGELEITANIFLTARDEATAAPRQGINQPSPILRGCVSPLVFVQYSV